MELNERRAVLYVTYLSDIEEFNITKNTDTLKEKWQEAMDYIHDKDFDWVDIYDNSEEPIGFIIVGHAEQCHPDADIYLADFFIDYRHRNKGIMTKEIKKILKGVKTCCYFVQKNNNYAQRWLNRIFLDDNFVSVKLNKSCIDFSDEDRGFYGWSRSKINTSVIENNFNIITK